MLFVILDESMINLFCQAAISPQIQGIPSLVNWAFGVLLAAISALCGVIAYLYKTQRAELETYRKEVDSLHTLMNSQQKETFQQLLETLTTVTVNLKQVQVVLDHHKELIGEKS